MPTALAAALALVLVQALALVLVQALGLVLVQALGLEAGWRCGSVRPGHSYDISYAVSSMGITAVI